MSATIKTLLGRCLLLLLLLSAVCSALPVSVEARSSRSERQATRPDGKPPVRIAGGRNAFFPGVGAVGSNGSSYDWPTIFTGRSFEDYYD